MASSVPMFTNLMITQPREVQICTEFHPNECINVDSTVPRPTS